MATAKHFDVAIAETCQKAHAIELRQRPARLASTALMFSLSGSRKNSAGGPGRAAIQVNPSEGVIRARAKIDGESGSFVVDTGASYVTPTRALVLRLKLDLERAPTVLLQTANGPRPGHLITVQPIEVQGLKAARVPAVVIDDFSGGIDGLLGLSFLSRFDLKPRHVQDRIWLAHDIERHATRHEHAREREESSSNSQFDGSSDTELLDF